MVGMSNIYGAYSAQKSFSENHNLKSSQAINTKENDKSNSNNNGVETEHRSSGWTSVFGASNLISQKSTYGKTIGEPKLSENAQKYYEQLKQKYGQYDFILVSKDQIEGAKANAAQYANAQKTVVLIDEEKIEKMASDPNYRKQYESILSGASAQLEHMKKNFEQSGVDTKGYGIQVNDGGTLSFFAVLRKSSAEQRARIESHRAEKKLKQKAEEKKEEKQQREEQIENRRKKMEESKIPLDVDDREEYITLSGDSLEELLQKVEAFNQENRTNQVMTDGELQVGQSIDFRG